MTRHFQHRIVSLRDGEKRLTYDLADKVYRGARGPGRAARVFAQPTAQVPRRGLVRWWWAVFYPLSFESSIPIVAADLTVPWGVKSRTPRLGRAALVVGEGNPVEFKGSPGARSPRPPERPQLLRDAAPRGPRRRPSSGVARLP